MTALGVVGHVKSRPLSAGRLTNQAGGLIEQEEFNPNVALEVGYLIALRKPLLLLKDKTLKNLNTDLIGKLYKTFDPHDISGTVPQQLHIWLKDKNLTA